MNHETVRLSRRGFIRTSAAFAAAAMVPPQDTRDVDDGGTLDRSWRQSVSANQRILLKGGTVVSMDPKVGNLVKGDVLIEGKKITAVSGRLRKPR